MTLRKLAAAAALVLVATPAFAALKVGDRAPDFTAPAYLAGDAGLSLAPHANFRAWMARVEAQPRFLAQSWDYSIDPHATGELPG